MYPALSDCGKRKTLVPMTVNFEHDSDMWPMKQREPCTSRTDEAREDRFWRRHRLGGRALSCTAKTKIDLTRPLERKNIMTASKSQCPSKYVYQVDPTKPKQYTEAQTNLFPFNTPVSYYYQNAFLHRCYYRRPPGHCRCTSSWRREISRYFLHLHKALLLIRIFVGPATNSENANIGF